MIKKLLAFVKGYEKQSLLAPLSVSGEVVMEVVLPLIMAAIIDNGLGTGNISLVIKLGCLMILCALVSLFFGAISGKFAAEASTGYAKNLRQAVFYKIQDFSFKNIDKFSTASLVTRLTTDITNIQNAYSMVIRMFIRSPLMLIFSLVMCIRISLKLSIIFFVAIPFLTICLYFIMTRVHPLFRAMFTKYDLVNRVVQENLIGIRTVKAYIREKHEIEKFEDSTKQLYDYSVNAEKLIILNSPIMQLTVYTCMILVSWFGAKLVFVGDISTGQLMSLFTYITQILSSLMMMSMGLTMVIMSRSSIDRVIEVLDEEIDLKNNDKAIKEVKDGSIDFENVSFSYEGEDGNYALGGLNFHIPSGATVGIIGGTGTGKSSLISLIPRLYDATEGSVKIAGVDVKDYDLYSLREAISVVLQKNTLFSGTIAKNLRWGDKNATDEQIIHASKLAQADEFVSTFPDGYDTMLDQGGTNVSGGQKQRLCIARALLKHPKILILDDSTSAVDTKTDALIRKAFKEEIPDTTKIIIAQRISSVQESDMIIVLGNGIIDAIGTHDELLATNKIYQEVYYSQVKGGEDDE